MNLSFPNSDPVLIDHGRPLVQQKLPAGLAARLALGSSAERGKPLAEDAVGTTAVTISLAERLHAAPKDVESLLARPVGSRFQAGEEIGRARKTRRGQSVLAPFDGVLHTYNPATGIALFMSNPDASMNALVSGQIERIEGDTIAIRTAGSRLFGIVGCGGDCSGPIRCISPDPSHIVSPQEITESLRGAIVVAGPWVSADAYKRFVEVGVAAVISGSLADAEVASAFGLSTTARLQAWGDAGATIVSPFAIVATEGFGQAPPHPAIWDFLKKRDGLKAIMLTKSVVGNGQTRPELLFEDGVHARPLPDLHAGSKLRLVDQSNLGMVAIASGASARGRFTNGRAIETIEAVLPNKSIATVPVRNVEYIA